jgi:hypothetical protein
MQRIKSRCTQVLLEKEFQIHTCSHARMHTHTPSHYPTQETFMGCRLRVDITSVSCLGDSGFEPKYEHQLHSVNDLCEFRSFFRYTTPVLKVGGISITRCKLVSMRSTERGHSLLNPYQLSPLDITHCKPISMRSTRERPLATQPVPVESTRHNTLQACPKALNKAEATRYSTRTICAR